MTRFQVLLAGFLVGFTVPAAADQGVCTLEKAAMIRRSPAPSGEVVASAPAGLSLNVADLADGWARITSPGAALGSFIPTAACRLAMETKPEPNPRAASHTPVAAASAATPQDASAASPRKPMKKGTSFWKKAGLGLLAAAAIAGTAYAAANSDGGYVPSAPDPATDERGDRWPCPGSYRKREYDAASGNSYTVYCSGDEIRMDGFNTLAGTMWQEYYRANGDMHGIDGHFRSWTYTASSGYYFRSDGRQCFGQRASRSCTGPPE